MDNFEVNLECLNRQPTDDVEARADFWSIHGDFIYRHHNELRVQLYVPKEETFLFPVKYIDVARCTHTDLDVLQEKRKDDYWNVDSNRNSPHSRRGFCEVYSIERKIFFRICVVRGETDNNSNDYQIMYGQKFGRTWVKPLRIEKKQEWAKEKPKLDNARRLRGI